MHTSETESGRCASMSGRKEEEGRQGSDKRTFLRCTQRVRSRIPQLLKSSKVLVNLCGI